MVRKVYMKTRGGVYRPGRSGQVRDTPHTDDVREEDDDFKTFKGDGVRPQMTVMKSGRVGGPNLSLSDRARKSQGQLVTAHNEVQSADANITRGSGFGEKLSLRMPKSLSKKKKGADNIRIKF